MPPTEFEVEDWVKSLRDVFTEYRIWRNREGVVLCYVFGRRAVYSLYRVSLNNKFEIGFSNPSELALSILVHYFGEPQNATETRAHTLYKEFEPKVKVNGEDTITITAEEIEQWLYEKEEV